MRDVVQLIFPYFLLQAGAADYDAVPIEQYGLAMLRGMGWKAEEGIGKTVKGYVKYCKLSSQPHLIRRQDTHLFYDELIRVC